MSTDFRADTRHAPPLIPGAYDRSTLTRRQAGSIGGPPLGAGDIPQSPSSMDAATIADRQNEGGGALSQRRRVGQPRERLRFMAAARG